MRPASINPTTANSTPTSSNTSSATSTTTAAPQVRSRSNSNDAAPLPPVPMSIPDQFLQAVAAGDINQAQALILKNAPVNHTDPDGKSALAIAAKNGDTGMMEALLDAGADADGSPKNPIQSLIGGVALGNGARVGLGTVGVIAAAAAFGGVGLVVGGVAAFALGAALSEKSDRSTPPIMAAQYGTPAAVELLLRRGATIDFRDARTHTALANAAEHGRTDTLNVLLANGAKVNLIDNDGMTALMYAAEYGHTDAVLALIQNKAEVNAKTSGGRTALILAAENGHTATVNALIKEGANVNHSATCSGSSEGETFNDGTALIFAARKGHTETIRALLNAGANVKAVTNEGYGTPDYTAFDIAKTKGHLAAADVLREAVYKAMS